MYIFFNLNIQMDFIKVGSRPEGYTEMMILSVLFKGKKSFFYFGVLPFFPHMCSLFFQIKLKWLSN